MAESIIKNPHVPYTVLAKSTGSKTFSQHLLALKSVYDALSQKERASTAIIYNNFVHRAATVSDSLGEYTMTSGDAANFYTQTLGIGNTPTAVSWSIKTSGNTFNNYVNNTYSGTIQLVYGI